MKTAFSLFLILALPAIALPDKLEENVVYVEEFGPKKGITLKVEKPGLVYSTNKGGRNRGALKVGIEVELVSTGNWSAIRSCQIYCAGQSRCCGTVGKQGI